MATFAAASALPSISRGVFFPTPRCERHAAQLGSSHKRFPRFAALLASAAAFAWPLKWRTRQCISRVRLRGQGDIDDFSAAELRRAINQLGFNLGNDHLPKQNLVELIEDLRIPALELAAALLKVRKQQKAKKSRQGSQKSEDPQTAKQQNKQPKTSWNDWTEGELRRVLNRIGLIGSRQLTAQECVQALKEVGVSHKQAKNVLKEDDGSHSEASKSGSQKGAKKKNIGRFPKSGHGRPKKPKSHEERQFYGVDEEDWAWMEREFWEAERRFDFDRQAGKKRHGRRRPDDFDNMSDFDDDDDFFSYVTDDAPWEHFSDEYEEPWSSSAGYDDFRWGNNWTYGQTTYGQSTYNQRSSSSSSYSQPKMTTEEAMTKALKEGWKADGLSRSQAISLLGLSGSFSDAEVSQVKRKMVLRWHPDKNPGDSNAVAAFQLVMAAAGKLNC